MPTAMHWHLFEGVIQMELRDQSASHANHKGNAGGGHFHLEIVSDSFAGAAQLERHRKGYAALKSMLGSDLHALLIAAFTFTELSVREKGGSTPL